MSITLQCPNHPRYNAMEAPRANCLHCIELYALKQAALRQALKVK